MPILPDIQGQSESPVPQPSQGVVAYDVMGRYKGAGLAAEEMGGVSQEIGRWGQQLHAQDEFNAQAALNQVSRSLTEAEYGSADGSVPGFKSVRGLGVQDPNFIQNALQPADDHAKQLAESLGDTMAKQIFDQHYQVARAHLMAGALAWKAQQTYDGNVHTAQEGIKLAINQANIDPVGDIQWTPSGTLIDNNTSFHDALLKIDNNAKLLFHTTGADQGQNGQENLNDFINQQHGIAWTARLTAIAEGAPGRPPDPGLASQLFEQNKDNIPPGLKDTIGKQLEAYQKDFDGRALAQDTVIGTAPTIEGKEPLPSASSMQTSDQMKVMKEPWGQWAHDAYLQQYPGDLKGADNARNQATNLAAQMIQQKEAVENQSSGVLKDFLVNSYLNGTVPTPEMVRNDPNIRQALASTSPTARESFARALSQGGLNKDGDPIYADQVMRGIVNGTVTNTSQIQIDRLNAGQLSRINSAFADHQRNPDGVGKQIEQVTSIFRQRAYALDQTNSGAWTYAYRNSVLDKIKAYQDAGKQTDTLFRTDTPDSVVTPNYMSAFIPSKQQQAFLKAAGIKAQQPQLRPFVGPLPLPPRDANGNLMPFAQFMNQHVLGIKEGTGAGNE
jgi:hypothetical protein